MSVVKMDSDNSIIYGLEFQARALAAQTAETETVRFLIGTQSLKQTNNQIHLVELSEDDGTLTTKVYQHPFGEIWNLTSSPSNSNIIATCFNTIDEENQCRMKTGLLRIPDNDGTINEMQSLEIISEYSNAEKSQEICTTQFNQNDKEKCATVADNKVIFFDIQNGLREISNVTLEGKYNPKFTTGKWYPHQNCTQFITASESHMLCYDMRNNSTSPVWKFEASPAHSLIRDLDANVNVQACVATCGDDACVRLWDTRNTSAPTFVRRDHSHWVWCVRFNTFHDQLLLSSSSDCRVLLSSVLSVSSEANSTNIVSESEENSEIESKERLSDGPLQWYEQHEDSVYCVEWSSADPWTFASLSYDGRLVVSRVPRHHKYRILL